MATKLYLRNTQGHNAYFPVGMDVFDLSPTPGAALTTKVVNTAASGTDIQWTNGPGGNTLWWVTPPLAAAFTLATTDTLTFNLWALENNMSANAGARVHIFRLMRYSNSRPEFGNSPFSSTVE